MDCKGLTFALPADTKFSASPKMVEIYNQAHATDEKVITIDASRAYWVSPFTACWFAALKDKLEDKGKILKVKPPTRDNALHQWESLGISSYISLLHMPYFGRYFPSFPVTRLVEPSYPLAGEVTHLLTDRLKGAENFHKALHFAIREVIDNSFEHGRVKSCYMAAYSVPSKNIVRLCILDCGIGIPGSLRENPRYSSQIDDSELVKLSMERGISAKPPGRGIGLYLLRDTVSKNKGAMVSILSGSALVEVTIDGLTEKHLQSSFTGTIVKLTLRTKERFNFISVSDWEDL